MHGLNKNYLLGSERFFEDIITLRLNLTERGKCTQIRANKNFD